MALIDLQNVVARSFEVQAVAQQAIYQAELAQKALALRVRRDAEDAPHQVGTMGESDTSRALELLSPEQRKRSRQYRQAVGLKKKDGGVSAPDGPKISGVLPDGHVDITV